MTRRYMLMTPGPIDISYATLREMAAPLVAHYGPDWVRVYQETEELVKQVLQTAGNIFMLVGAGTAGLDAAVGGLLRRGEKALVLDNGWFADRLAQIAEAYEVDVHRLSFDILKPIPVEPVHAYLEAQGDIQAVLMVHNETHTGIVNPVEEIGTLCRQADVPLILDAVSSAGGVELKVDEWGVDLCVTGSQKGLEAPPGLALIAVSERAWRCMDAKGPTGHGFYLDPRVWRKYRQDWGDWHPTHTTMASSLVLALRASLRRIMAEGLEEHFARYRRVSRVVKHALENIGFELLADPSLTSPTMTTALTPHGIEAVRFRDFLRDRCNILISFGPPMYRERTIRVGHMGAQMELDHIIPLLCGLEEAGREFGLNIPRGVSLDGIHAYWETDN